MPPPETREVTRYLPPAKSNPTQFRRAAVMGPSLFRVLVQQLSDFADVDAQRPVADVAAAAGVHGHQLPPVVHDRAAAVPLVDRVLGLDHEGLDPLAVVQLVLAANDLFDGPHGVGPQPASDTRVADGVDARPRR